MALKIKTQIDVTPEPVVIPQKVFVQTPESEIEAMTAEYLDLHKKFVYFEVKAMVKRMEEIKKQLQTIANETMDGHQPAVFTCSTGEIEFSERGTVTSVPHPLTIIEELHMKFGPETASSVVNIAITPLRKLLSEHELQKFVIEEPGSRTLRKVRSNGSSQ